MKCLRPRCNKPVLGKTPTKWWMALCLGHAIEQADRDLARAQEVRDGLRIYEQASIDLG